MSEKVILNWSNSTTIDNETFPKDTLGRMKYAQFLTQFLVDQGNDSSKDGDEGKRNYVLNLNSEWGSGKTYFLKRWSEDLKPHFPVVYIDAWKQDYSNDPLMTVISSVISQLREQADIKKKSDFEVPKQVVGLLKAAAPALIKTFSKKYFGVESLNELSDSDEKSDDNFIDLSSVNADAVKYLINEHEEKSQAISDLKASVAEWVSFVADNPENTKQYPAFIFIDELDRCRPSYAVEMLETIKHIFDIKGIVFVVATDTEQLQHAVKAIYGEGFDARLYLGRFFNSRFSLKAPDLKDFLEVHVDHHKLSGEYLKKAEISILPPNEDGKITLRNIAVILDAFNMPPRTAIQITDRVIATLSNMPKGSKIDILMLTTLLCFSEENNELFNKIISESFRHKNEKMGAVSLEKYIVERFSSAQAIISMQINPEIDHPTLNTPLGFYTNPHVMGDYKMSLKTYLESFFVFHFSSRHNPETTFDYLNKKDITSNLYKSIQSQLQLNAGVIPYENLFTFHSLPLLKILYFQNKFNEISLNQYKDYVELASALDWIDGTSDDV